MKKKPAQLEQILGYKFRELAILERALTHRSWAHESAKDRDKKERRILQNEAFEFVGDSVLGLIIAEVLFEKNPEASEGDLTLMKHRIVSGETLVRIAAKLKLGDFIRIGRGEEKTGGRKKEALLANAFEAIIGAVFLDGGYIEARAFVKKLFNEEIRTVTPSAAMDYKTLLQEKLQAAKLPAPVYNLLKTEGPDHSPTFFVEASFGEKRVRAKGKSIKSAEMAAARIALGELASANAKYDPLRNRT